MTVAVHIRIPQPWDIPEHQLTPEALYWNRRQILRAMGLTGVGLASVLAGCKSNQEVEQQIQQRAQTLPKLSAERNDTFSLDRPLTEEKVAAHYNNFAQFIGVCSSAKTCEIGENLLSVSDPISRPQERLINAGALNHTSPLQHRPVSRLHPYTAVERALTPVS